LSDDKVIVKFTIIVLKYILYFSIYEYDSIIEETVICINVYQYKRINLTTLLWNCVR